MNKNKKYTQRCLDIVYLMQNGWILLVGRSDSNDSIYYQVTIGFQRESFNSRVFTRLINDDLIQQGEFPRFHWELTKTAKNLKFKSKKK